MSKKASALTTTELEARPADNFFEFVRDQGLPAFPRQIQIASEIFGEWCPECNPDLVLRSETTAEIAATAVFRKHGRCGLCGSTQDSDEQHWHATVCIGQRGGKDHLIQLMALYLEHRALCHRPNHALIPPNSPLHIVLTSCSENSATYMMTGLQHLRNMSPWFKAYQAAIRREGLAPAKSASLEYCWQHKALMTVAGKASAAQIIRGKTGLAVLMNESAWYGADYDCDELAKLLISANAACQTVRDAARVDPQLLGGFVVSMSSLHTVDDTFSRALRKSGPRYYSCRVPSWNMNPKLAGHDLTRCVSSVASATAEVYRAERDVGCRFLLAPFQQGLEITRLPVDR